MKPLYDSPDIPLIDYTNTNGRSGGPRSYVIDDRTLVSKVNKENDARGILDNLDGMVRGSDITKIANIVLKYLEDNIPDVSKYTDGLPKGATDEDKIAAITKGLEERATAIDEYNSRVISESPFLGNEVEEARSKQEGPEVAVRYKTQYSRIPGVRARENRSAVKSYEVQRNPKTKATRMKFI